MISSAKASSKLGYLWRVCGTGLGFVGFGVGGLAIGTVLAPMVRVLHKDKYKQEIHAQKIIQKGFMGFMQSLKGLGVMTYDVEGLDKLQDSYGELVIGAAAGRSYVADECSIADFAIMGWAWRHERHQVDLADYPNVKRWYEAIDARPAVQRGVAVLADRRKPVRTDKEKDILFGAAQYAKR